MAPFRPGGRRNEVRKRVWDVRGEKGIGHIVAAGGPAQILQRQRVEVPCGFERYAVVANVVRLKQQSSRQFPLDAELPALAARRFDVRLEETDALPEESVGPERRARRLDGARKGGLRETSARIEGVAADRPAEYELILAGGTVEIPPHDFRWKFVTLEPWNIRITFEDLERGQCSVRVPDTDLFLPTFSREGKPVQNGQVTVYLEMRSFEITTDEAGTVAVLGDPRSYILAVEGGWKLDITLIILPASARHGILVLM